MIKATKHFVCILLMQVDKRFEKLTLFLDVCAVVRNLVVLVERFLVIIDFVAQNFFFLLRDVLAEQHKHFVLNLLQVIIIGIFYVEIVPLLIVNVADGLLEIDLMLNLILK